MKIQNQAAIAFSVGRYQKNNSKMEKTLEKLASGLEIKTASDSASGLAVSETMRAQIRGISQAQRNMQDGLSVLQASNEGLNHVNGLLQRVRELGVMAANDTFTHEDRQAAQVELDQLLQGINDTAVKLEFNTKKILGENAPLILMVGANPGQQIKVDLVDISTNFLDITGSTLLTSDDAEKLISKVDIAITRVGSELTKIGSHYEAIEHHLRNASSYETNLTTSFSSLTDANMAKKVLDYTTISLRKNSDQLLVSEVNQNTRNILKLFK